MAYVRRHTCATCGGRASAEVVDRWNGSAGDYCAAHLRAALARKIQQESPGIESKELRDRVREALA